jgi:uncharacterized membrane protein YedE/YeeE
MNRHAFAVTFAAAVLMTTGAVSAQQPVALPQPAAPQGPVAPQLQKQIPYQSMDAGQVRDQLQEILRMYPPGVGEVLRYDHSLLERADYLAPYPNLVLFLQQHPEVKRNPQFYFGGYNYYERRRSEPMPPEVEALGVLLGGLGGFLGVAAFIVVLTCLVKSVIHHRRWLRASRVQAEVHAKIMDRMTTNEELLAYIQSPAGRRFLESTPLPEADAPRSGAPVGPIIWSMMAGIVLATAGIGFRLSAGSISSEAANAFNIVGTIIVALGAGFVLSAVMAYLVSSRLGLFPQRPRHDVSSDNA